MYIRLVFTCLPYASRQKVNMFKVSNKDTEGRQWPHFDVVKLQDISQVVVVVLTLARSKTRKTRKSRKTRNFSSEIFKSEFSILALGQNRKLGNKKTRNNISKISEVSEFSICHFLFSFLFFFFFYRCFFQDLYFTFVTSSTLYKYSSFISLTKYDFMCLFWSIKYIHNRQYI